MNAMEDAALEAVSKYTEFNVLSVLTLSLQGPWNAIKRTDLIDFGAEKWQLQANFGIKLGISPFDGSISISIGIEIL